MSELTDNKIKEARKLFRAKFTTGIFQGLENAKYDDRVKLDRDITYAELEQWLTQAFEEALANQRSEIADSIPELFLEWRKYVNAKYEKGSKTRKSQVILDFPTWLADALKIVEEVK